MAQSVKDLPVMQAILVQPLGQGAPLEKGMTTYPSILAWRIPWNEETGGPRAIESESTHAHT